MDALGSREPWTKVEKGKEAFWGIVSKYTKHTPETADEGEDELGLVEELMGMLGYVLPSLTSYIVLFD